VVLTSLSKHTRKYFQIIVAFGHRAFIIEINRYGFFEADTDISAIHGPIYQPIPIFPKFLNLVFYFIIKSRVYFMPYLFFKTSKIRIYKQKFLKLQQFQYLINVYSIHCLQ